MSKDMTRKTNPENCPLCHKKRVLKYSVSWSRMYSIKTDEIKVCRKCYKEFKKVKK